MKNFSLESIRNNLNEFSSKEEINEYLLYDLKAYYPLDKDKFDQHAEYKRFTKKTVEDLQYDFSDRPTAKIEDFFKYRVCNGFGLKCYTAPNSALDIDMTEEVKEILKEVLSNNMMEKGIQVGDISYNKGRNFTVKTEGRKIEIDTDTMNSFFTVFKNYLKLALNEYSGKERALDDVLFEEYKEVYKNDDGECIQKNTYKFTYLLDFMSGKQKIYGANYSEIIDDLSSKNKEYAKTTELFNEYAKLTHTIGNFVFVPKGFNGKRGINAAIQDYWDRTLMYLKELVSGEKTLPCYKQNEESYNWYVENYDLFNMEMFFDNINSKKVKNLTMDKNMFEDIKDFNRYIETINSLIKLRGISILKTINVELQYNENIEELEKELIKKVKNIEEMDLER